MGVIRVISRVTILVTHIRGLLAPLLLLSTHEPPSRALEVKASPESIPPSLVVKGEKYTSYYQLLGWIFGCDVHNVTQHTTTNQQATH